MNTELIEKTGSDAGQRVTTFIVHCNGETRVVKASEHDAVGIIIERGRFGTDTDEMNIFLGEFDGSLIEAVEIEDGEFFRPLAAIYKKNKVLSPAMKQFLAILKDTA